MSIIDQFGASLTLVDGLASDRVAHTECVAHCTQPARFESRRHTNKVRQPLPPVRRTKAATAAAAPQFFTTTNQHTRTHSHTTARHTQPGDDGADISCLAKTLKHPQH